jgi:nucleotide-binding universal stress UspA family protein
VTPTPQHAPIVVGLDLADADHDPVLGAALEQARLRDAPLCVVHTITADAPLAATAAAGPDAGPAYRTQLDDRRVRVQDATDGLRRHVARLAPGSRRPVVLSFDVRQGDPATRVLGAAQHADLIVIGTRRPGNHDFPFLLGTVSQDIAVHATCPVLLVPTS